MSTLVDAMTCCAVAKYHVPRTARASRGLSMSRGQAAGLITLVVLFRCSSGQHDDVIGGQFPQHQPDTSFEIKTPPVRLIFGRWLLIYGTSHYRDFLFPYTTLFDKQVLKQYHRCVSMGGLCPVQLKSAWIERKRRVAERALRPIVCDNRDWCANG